MHGEAKKTKKKLKKRERYGEKIYTWRTAFTYSHHGKVIHFTQDKINLRSSSSTRFSSSSPKSSTFCCSCEALGLRKQTSGVIESCLDCFLGNGSLYRFVYGVTKLAFGFKLRGGTCSLAPSDAADVVIKRARNLLENGFGEYHVLSNNCEDFASYCKTGAVCNREPGFCQASSVLGVAAAALLKSLFGDHRSGV